MSLYCLTVPNRIQREFTRTSLVVWCELLLGSGTRYFKDELDVYVQ